MGYFAARSPTHQQTGRSALTRRALGVVALFAFACALAHAFLHDLSSAEAGHYEAEAEEICHLAKLPATTLPAPPVVPTVLWAASEARGWAADLVADGAVGLCFAARAPPFIS